MKNVKLGIVAIMSAVVFSGCSIMDMIAPQATGVVMYGDETGVQQTMDQYKDKIESQNKFEAKLGTVNGKKVLIMNKTTAEKMVKENMLKKVVKEDVEPIKALPAISDEAGIVFANEEQKDVVIDGKKMKYEGNVVIGDARKYTDMYAVVSDAEYAKISEPVKTIGLASFKENPKEKIFLDIKRDSKVEEAHMVEVK
ncbi:lipoprotein BA_5634 family protein [Bacillus paranthracis]|uniref:lipoprotein BA_5634 family protein n=1 Tax=Bacillus paranthracis TaxID=2026186 RepID=UPI002151A4EB|nr:lipoprotein BA_5634 family protein [Bacillus paranthracis]MCR6466389.1 lipoprotein BA_5634 family protein [Bacillus paranthracis]MCR9020781.1 lipoprotein BA_5634 family protein [Bacillus paranthracis]